MENQISRNQNNMGLHDSNLSSLMMKQIHIKTYTLLRLIRQSPPQILILRPISSPLTAFKLFKISSGSGRGVHELRRLPFDEYVTGGISENG